MLTEYVPPLTSCYPLYYRDRPALREAMSNAHWMTAAAILQKYKMCRFLHPEVVINYLKRHGRQKCAEYDVPYGLQASTIRCPAMYEAHELATAMGLDELGAYPARNTLFNAAQDAVEGRTVSTAYPKQTAATDTATGKHKHCNLLSPTSCRAPADANVHRNSRPE